MHKLQALPLSDVSALEMPMSRAVMGLSAIIQIMDDSKGQGHMKNDELAMLLDTAVLRPLLEVQARIFAPR